MKEGLAALDAITDKILAYGPSKKAKPKQTAKPLKKKAKRKKKRKPSVA